MKYHESFNILKKDINYHDEAFCIHNFNIYNFSFISKSFNILPGSLNYNCKDHNINFEESNPFFNDIGTINDSVIIKDCDVMENKIFRYHIFLPSDIKKAKKTILLLHGFNEKTWDKYLPWAKTLAESTGSAVVLFPISFHMNRASSDWSNKRKMYELSQKRKKRFPDILNSSLSNVAISMRINLMPQRFIWSGLQTYNDILQFVSEIKTGNNPIIEKNTTIDFFGYSIGCLLAQILKLSNKNNYFSNSQVCMFCGGAVFNKMSPVSKFIMDSESCNALHLYYLENFEKHLIKDLRLNHYLNEVHSEGLIFRSMLDYHLMSEFRENLFKKFQDDFYAICLVKDKVIPSHEIINTLHGINGEIKIPVDILDFSYDYSHENPFPIRETQKGVIDTSFKEVFNKVSAFFNKGS